jgi:hypothetical protein
MPKNTNWVK